MPDSKRFTSSFLLETLGHIEPVLPGVFYLIEGSGSGSTPKWVTPNILSVTGFTPEEIFTNPNWWSEGVFPPDRNQAFGGYATALSQGTFVHEYRFVKKDDSVIWLRDQLQRILTPDGEPDLIIGSWTDITKLVETKAELCESHRQLSEAQELARIGSWDLDLTSDTLVWSAEIYKIFGVDPDRFGASLQSFFEAIHPDDVPIVEEAYRTSIEADTDYDVEHRIVRRDTGEIRWVHERCQHQRDSDGAVIRSYGTVQDITERREAQERLQQSQEDLRLSDKVFENAGDAIMITDANSIIVDVNPAYLRITGFKREEVIGNKPNMNSSGRHDQRFYQDMWVTLKETGSWEGEIWDRRKNGEIYPKWLSISAISNDHGEITHYVGIFKDVSEQKAIESKLESLAYFDPLTSLPNRSLFSDRLTQELQSAHRRKSKVALLFIDLDRFKYVNDTLGHEAGDMLLVEVADRLKSSLREVDTVARLGGDEFTVILTDLKDQKVVGRISQTIIDSLSMPFRISGQDVYLGASIGISIYPDDGKDAATLTKNADMAMYRAKDSGRRRYHFYHPEMDELAHKRAELERSLRRALENDEFRVFYQPKVDIETNRIVGMEALVRWVDPQGRIISPADFIPVAEENGLVVQIDQLVMQNACRQAKAWRDEGWDLRVAVNLSALQFRQNELCEIVAGILTETGLPAHALELEITESAVMDDPEAAVKLVRKLREMGVYISIDDFGTGYSSLAYLKTFPIHTLKIDQAFVRELTSDSEDAAIVRAIIDLAKSLNLHVVAEGIETNEQAKFLGEHRCSSGQGYYYSKPVPADEFTSLLEASVVHSEQPFPLIQFPASVSLSEAAI